AILKSTFISVAEFTLTLEVVMPLPTFTVASELNPLPDIVILVVFPTTARDGEMLSIRGCTATLARGLAVTFTSIQESLSSIVILHCEAVHLARKLVDPVFVPVNIFCPELFSTLHIPGVSSSQSGKVISRSVSSPWQSESVSMALI